MQIMAGKFACLRVTCLRVAFVHKAQGLPVIRRRGANYTVRYLATAH